MEKLDIVSINFTASCNLQCPHCGPSEFKPKNELSASDFYPILNELSRMKVSQLNLTGGEVFLRPDFMLFFEKAAENFNFISIETNGTLLTDDILSRLSLYKDKIRVSVSVDGAIAEAHERIRGTGSYQMTMQGLNLLKKFSIPTRVITVLNKWNIDQIPQMVKEFVNDMGFSFRLIPHIMEYGRGVYGCNSLGASYSEIIQLLEDFYYPFLAESKDSLSSVELNPALVPIDTIQHHVCPWGKSMLGINAQGDVGLCHVSLHDKNFVFGNIATNTIENIWNNSKTLRSFRQFSLDSLKGVCGNCLAKEVCRGGCRLHAFAKYGDIYAPDPQCQIVYNMGAFPDYALENEDQNCRYGGE